MERYKYTLIGLFSFLLMACSREGSEVSHPVYGTDPISFASSIGSEAVTTRAVDQLWEAGDEVGIFMTNDDYSMIHNANYLHTATSVAADTRWDLVAETGSELYYPVNGSHVRFIAYYPYLSGISSLDAAYPIILGTQDNAAAFDLLWYKDISGNGKFNKASSTRPALAFTHQLAKVLVNVKLSAEMEDSDLSDMEVSLTNVPTRASFDLVTGEIGEFDVGGDVSLAITTTVSDYNKSFQAIVIPHGPESDFTSRTLTFTFIDPTGINVTLTWTGLLDTKTFDKNTLYTYNFTLTRTAVELVGVTINAWGTSTPENITL